MSTIKKLTVAIVLFFIVSVVYVLTVLTVFNPKLSSIEVSEENNVGSYISPDRAHEVTVYFNGGLIFYSDITYVGVIENIASDAKRNIFLVASNGYEFRWVDNEHITLNGTTIALNETYDFRNE